MTRPATPATPGCTIFFTGLSASGKSTVAAALVDRLVALGRSATMLDGDLVRARWHPGLGFSQRDRDENIRRLGAMAADITGRGGVAVCAVIAPYDAARRDVRRMIENRGGFVLVYLSTPIAVCEARDPKGLYARARSGAIANFTGVSDPYEPPTDAEVAIDTAEVPLPEAVDRILAHLAGAGYLQCGAA